MFGSKDVCILKMTIDFNGSMNPHTLPDPFVPECPCLSVREYVRANKYVH